jgi:hypothetical protein
MPQPSMPQMPGMDAMTDTLDFVKNLWGGMALPGMSMPNMGMPGMVMPTLSVEEINKQISDLKAVESWLTLNMNMLRGTIQALEVQSATISTLQAMSESLSAAVAPKPAKKAPPESPRAGKEPAATAEAPYRATEKPDEPHGAAAGEQSLPSGAPPRAKGAAATDESGAALANPAIWWNLLQDQFKQAVNTALAAEKPAPTGKPKAAAKPAAKKAAPRKRKAAAKTVEK